MDKIDEQILSYLQDDGRAPFTDIADEIGVSEGTVRNRVQQMQDDGVIERFSVDIADTGAVSVIVMIAVDPEAEMGAILTNLPENMTVSEVTGEWDVVSQFSRPTSEQVNDTLEEIRKTDGVRKTQTYTVLASHEH